MSDELDDLTETPAPVRRGGRGVADKETLAERERGIRARKMEADADLRWLLEQEQFRRYAWRWLVASGFFERKRLLNAEGYVLHGRAEMGMEMWVEMRDVNLDALLEMFRSASLTKREPDA